MSTEKIGHYSPLSRKILQFFCYIPSHIHFSGIWVYCRSASLISVALTPQGATIDGLFSACVYKLRLQETMNVRLTSGIIVATPSMRKHVWSWTLNNYTNDKNGDDKRPSVRRLYISSRKCDPRPPYLQRDMDSGLQEQERLYKFDKKQETLMNEMLWLCSKPMERWLDMCLALSCWVSLDSKAF